jgi:DNA-binding NtrC family response regulator
MAKVLVIDDDLTYLDPLRNHLEAISHDVVGLDKRALALTVTEAYDPDLVILDIRMSVSRKSILKQLKQQCPRRPVIIYSADASYRDNPDFAAADAFIVKSPDFSDLIDKVISTLSPVVTLMDAKPRRKEQSFSVPQEESYITVNEKTGM